MDIALKNGDFDLNQIGMPYLLDGIAKVMQRIYVKLKVEKNTFLHSGDIGEKLSTINLNSELLEKEISMIIEESVLDMHYTFVDNIKVSVLENQKLNIKLDVHFCSEFQTLEVTL